MIHRDGSAEDGTAENPGERWRQSLDQLRQAQVIDDADENALIRHYNERAQNLKEELDRLTPEYLRRVEQDGEANANQWLAETATAMGRRDAEETRELLSRLSAD